MIGVFVVSLASGQGTDGFDSLAEAIKAAVSEQIKLEGKAIKEEILKEIQKEQFRKDLDDTKEGKWILNISELSYC